MPIERWWAPPSAGEIVVLDDVLPAALDVGCGPARHVLALDARGVTAVGLDSSTEAVRAARARGAVVHHGSIFDVVPGAGTWGSALLFDGNIGIGGDPVALLDRVRRVLRPRRARSGGGRATPGAHRRTRGARRLALGPRGRLVPVGPVSAADLGRLAGASGFRLAALVETEGRWFGRLERT